MVQIGSAGLTVDQLAERLAGEFGALFASVSVQEPDTVLAEVDRGKLKEVARRLYDLSDVPFQSCNVVAAVDYVTHIDCVYHLYSYPANLYLELHVRLSRANPRVPSVSDVWPAAEWHEREAWDMMGVRFDGHPDPRRILLKDDFVGHPLRKDYVDDVRNHPYV